MPVPFPFLLPMRSAAHAGPVFCAALALSTLAVRPATAQEASPPAAAALKPHEVVGRALQFLEKDAVKWRAERGCATCHHGTLTVWALSEAKQQGYPVAAESLAENLAWTRNQFMHRFSKPRDSR